MGLGRPRLRDAESICRAVLWARQTGSKRGHATNGERVARTQKFTPAFECALASGKPEILNCLLDPRAQSHAKDCVPHQVAAS
jgi:hypothetical protein